ncbi:hypothetical protein ONZ45_g5664 [Pleurotus djamor]|nr:hypothetical protein ONZ45_g5664 [Pleurotus djamor]
MPPSVTPKKAAALSQVETAVLILQAIPPRIVPRLKRNVFLRKSAPHLFGSSLQLGMHAPVDARKKRRVRSDEDILQTTTVPKIPSLLSGAPRSIRPVDVSAEPWKDPAVVFGLDYSNAYWMRKITAYNKHVEGLKVLLSKHTVALNMYGPWEVYIMVLLRMRKKLHPTVTIVEPDLTVERKQLMIRQAHIRNILQMIEARLADVKKKMNMSILDLNMSDITRMMKEQADMMIKVTEESYRREERERKRKDWAREMQCKKAKEAEEKARQRRGKAAEGNA